MNIYKFNIVVLFSCLVGCGQDASFDSCDLYSISLNKIQPTGNMPLMVVFDYEISPSLKASLFDSEFFKNDGIVFLEGRAKISLCQPVRQKLMDLEVIDNPLGLDEYIKINYSTPIIGNDETVYLFFERLSIKKNRGVKGGALMVHKFTKLTGKWELKETKVVEWF